MQVLIPPDDIIADYQSIVENLDNIIENNVTQVRTLTNIRDTLLPKLMSGEIRVPIEEVQ
jgi:type I restriction enzyme S subunit